jgi:hypothetical protein
MLGHLLVLCFVLLLLRSEFAAWMLGQGFLIDDLALIVEVCLYAVREEVFLFIPLGEFLIWECGSSMVSEETFLGIRMTEDWAGRSCTASLCMWEWHNFRVSLVWDWKMAGTNELVEYFVYVGLAWIWRDVIGYQTERRLSRKSLYSIFVCVGSAMSWKRRFWVSELQLQD